MLRRIRRICCVFMMMGSASLTLAASENTESGRMSAMYSYAPSQVLRFEYTKGKIYVEATVNDAHKGKYLLDTGGGFILLDKALAEKMGLKTIGTITAHSAQGERHTATLSTIASFAVGAQRMNNPAVGVFDFSGGIDGIIGGRFFEEFTVTIDFRSKTIYFENDESLRYRRRDGAIVPVSIDRYQQWGLDFYVLVQLKDDKWVRQWGVDTGRYNSMFNMDDILLLSGGIPIDQLKKLKEMPEVSLSLLDCPQIRMDNPRLSPEKAIKDGLLGNSFMQNYIVTFNIRDGYMIFSEPEKR
jgi:predicted aspartyl protease